MAIFWPFLAIFWHFLTTFCRFHMSFPYFFGTCHFEGDQKWPETRFETHHRYRFQSYDGKNRPPPGGLRPPGGIEISLMMVKMGSRTPGRVGFRPPGGIDFSLMMVKMGSKWPKKGVFSLSRGMISLSRMQDFPFPTPFWPPARGGRRGPHLARARMYARTRPCLYIKQKVYYESRA